MKQTKFEATPLFIEDSVVFCSPFNEVIALDPGIGVQKWRYDPKLDTNQASRKSIHRKRVGDPT
jgi:quinoprotein glucose dehydrogenase